MPHFYEEVWLHFGDRVKGLFNEEDRHKAGLMREFYEDLRGEVWDSVQSKFATLCVGM